MSSPVLNLVARLASASPFARVSDDDLGRLLASAARVRLRDEQPLFARGDRASHVYIVLSGSVRITTMAASGKRITAAIFQRDEMLGEIGAIDDGVRTADATAMGPVEVLRIPATTFRDVLAVSAPLANNVLRMALERLRRTYGLLEDASLRSVEARFARQILYLLKLGSVGGQHVRLQVRMHQDELADLLGVTTRSVINVLNKWRAEDLASFDGRTAQLTILDLERFRGLIEE